MFKIKAWEWYQARDAGKDQIKDTGQDELKDTRINPWMLALIKLKLPAKYKMRMPTRARARIWLRSHQGRSLPAVRQAQEHPRNLRVQKSMEPGQMHPLGALPEGNGTESARAAIHRI